MAMIVKELEGKQAAREKEEAADQSNK